MSVVENFQQKLLREYTNKASSPTPYQIETRLYKQEQLVILSQKTGISNFQLLEEVFYPDGSLLQNKLEGFLKSLSKIAEMPEGGEMICFLSKKCIKGEGSINIRKLKRNYKKGKTKAGN